MNFPHTATIQRMGDEIDGKFTYANNGTTKCFLQPIDATSAALYSIVFSKGSVCYLPIDSIVKEKDRLVIDNGTYGVRGVQTHNYGNLAHKKAVLEQI